MVEHWMTDYLLGSNASFQRAAREYAEEYTALAVAAECERIARWLEWTEGGNSEKADRIRNGAHWAVGALEL